MSDNKPYILVMDSGAYRHLIEDNISGPNTDSIFFYKTRGVSGIDVLPAIMEEVDRRDRLPTAILACPFFAHQVLYGASEGIENLSDKGFEGAVFLNMTMPQEGYPSLYDLFERGGVEFLSEHSDLPYQERKDTAHKFFTETAPELLKADRATPPVPENTPSRHHNHTSSSSDLPQSHPQQFRR